MLDGQSLHLVVLHKNSDAGKAEESSELGISISLITFGADPDVDYFGDLLAILQREQLPDDPITAAVDGAEALQGSAERVAGAGGRGFYGLHFPHCLLLDTSRQLQQALNTSPAE
jgi:hypothetical protein